MVEQSAVDKTTTQTEPSSQQNEVENRISQKRPASENSREKKLQQKLKKYQLFLQQNYDKRLIPSKPKKIIDNNKKTNKKKQRERVPSTSSSSSVSYTSSSSISDFSSDNSQNDVFTAEPSEIFSKQFRENPKATRSQTESEDEVWSSMSLSSENQVWFFNLFFFSKFLLNIF